MLVKNLPHDRYYKGFVLGFMFNEKNLNKVVLIKKNRPKFLKDKLNGIGGKIDVGESHLSAMKREFYEETGVYHDNWEFLGTFIVGDLDIHCFTALGPTNLCVQITDEELFTVHLQRLNEEVLADKVEEIIQIANERVRKMTGNLNSC